MLNFWVPKKDKKVINVWFLLKIVILTPHTTAIGECLVDIWFAEICQLSMCDFGSQSMLSKHMSFVWIYSQLADPYNVVCRYSSHMQATVGKTTSMQKDQLLAFDILLKCQVNFWILKRPWKWILYSPLDASCDIGLNIWFPCWSLRRECGLNWIFCLSLKKKFFGKIIFLLPSFPKFWEHVTGNKLFILLSLINLLSLTWWIYSNDPTVSFYFPETLFWTSLNLLTHIQLP